MNKKIIKKDIENFFKVLFPINRSLTGNGNRKTLNEIKKYIPINVQEYESGLDIYDWKIPDEWKVKDAWIKDLNGKKLIDFTDNNLHLVGYSIPVNKKLNFKQLRKRLHYIKGRPNTIPYRTSYYNKDWGFCISENQYQKIKNSGDEFDVLIDSNLDKKGSLTIGEILIPGDSKKEILISTYICHPSLANDNLSGIILTTILAKEILKMKKRKYSYRIVWLPETIGAIAYCYKNSFLLKKIDFGLVITTVAGPGKIGYKKSFDDKHSINKIVEDVFKENSINYNIYPFDINGSDERQYSSKGFRINIVSITKSKYYEYKEYHTSDDNLNFVKSDYLLETLDIYLKIIKKIELRVIYENISHNCETMLSKHGLYPELGGNIKPDLNKKSELDKILWILFKSDGKLSTEDIANEIGEDHTSILKLSKMLERKKILRKI